MTNQYRLFGQPSTHAEMKAKTAAVRALVWWYIWLQLGFGAIYLVLAPGLGGCTTINPFPLMGASSAVLVGTSILAGLGVKNSKLAKNPEMLPVGDSNVDQHRKLLHRAHGLGLLLGAAGWGIASNAAFSMAGTSCGFWLGAVISTAAIGLTVVALSMANSRRGRNE